MKKHALAILAVAALLSGCSAVYSPEPMGDKAVELDASWSGTWLSDDAMVNTKVLDAANGVLQGEWTLTRKGINIAASTWQAAEERAGETPAFST